ncbi:MAG TPA: hypothetical protein VKA64_02130 [Gammaproteobacteria bacterium]|nr:hypothetical protein [Gammaproteobacteria bacterium]
MDQIIQANPQAPGDQPTKPSASDNQLRQQAEAEWKRDAALQAEFGGRFETYLAYRKAAATGCLKVLGGANHV